MFRRHWLVWKIQLGGDEKAKYGLEIITGNEVLDELNRRARLSAKRLVYSPMIALALVSQG